MSQYYILKPAVGTKETGMAYPAVENFEDYDFNKANSVYKLDSDSFPDFIPDISYKLAKGAKLCDVMEKSNISACGLLINEKVKEVLEQFNLVPHKYFPATIEDKGIIHQYYWVHFVWEDGIKYLDFANSKFKIKRASKDLGEVEVQSLNELHSKQGELGFMNMIHNYEYTFINPNFDLFIHPLNKTIFVSENLKSKMANFSGSDFITAQYLKVV
jgi:hypothetical protein